MSAVCGDPSRAIVLLAAGALAVGALACGRAEPPPPTAPTLVVRDAWARSADSGGTTAVYFVLENIGTIADTLRSVGSPLATNAGVHVSMDRRGTMQMVSVRSLPVSGRDSVVFRPLATHVMLTGLRASIGAGDSLSLTLDFTSGTTLAVAVAVRQP